MEKYSVRINLSKIDKDHIFTSNSGDKFILASIVHKEKSFEDGENYQGFIQQYWKDETLPPGQYPKLPYLGNFKSMGKPQPNPSQDQTPGLEESPF